MEMSDNKRTIMAIGAHIGDMELTCGGVLASQALKGDKIVTVALTAGEKGNPPSMSVEDYRIQKVEEAANFAHALGGESVVLDNPDGLLKHDEETTWAVCDIIRRYKPDVIITHWKESVHKDHSNTYKIVSDARYYAANAGFIRDLPAHPCPNMYFAENWEDSRDFNPYLYVDISSGYELWYREVKKHWFVTHSTDYRYLEYYDALSICRGCEARMPRAQAFMVREFRDRVIKKYITD
jgi:LmbE family N-acetylglucosaminyl deacetylase